jgi:broad specificity phosphatase PhoE
MKAIFIRHGQSTGNAGVPCTDLATIELTEKGWNQARQVAMEWTEKPSLIVTSPFLRTQQTAAPTIERFPDVPVQVWPIEEFTYLQPSRWNGTLPGTASGAVLGRSRSGVLRWRRSGEFRHIVTPRRGGVRTACRPALSRPGLCFQPWAIYSGSACRCRRIRDG